MKRFLPYLLAIILTMIIFTGCNLDIKDKDAFDLNDTVTVAIGEKIYENDRLWVRLDKITLDSRCPEGYQCYIAGHVEGQFTVGGWGAQETLEFHTDSVSSMSFMVPFEGQFTIGGGNVYILNILDIRPERPDFENPIPKSQYRVDFVLEAGAVARKPNLYLYPEKKTKMSVSMDFPHGGKVIESDPAYPDQWENIKVKPNGKIDKKYDYLYYECEIPDFWQYHEGWVLKQENLHDFFDLILEEYGFNEKEIEDFLEFWIPELKKSPYYIIYPQYTEMVNRVIKLWISPRPDSIMRLHFVISEFDKKFYLPVPEIPDFEREGYYATEWGVILK